MNSSSYKCNSVFVSHPPTTNDYITPALIDCWSTILDYVTEPNDLCSLTNSCRLFNDILHERKIRELLLPVLLNSISFSKNAVLSMRKVSRRMKGEVDRFLYSHQPAWLSESFALEDSDEIKEFVKYTRYSVENSFIAKYLKLTCRDSVEEVMTLLQLKGREIVELNLELFHTDDTMILNRHLIQALQFIPNVESLCLKCVCVGDENIDWEEIEGQPGTLLPPLRSLTKLKITIDSEDGFSPEGFMRHVVEAYGAQLTLFSCSPNYFGIDLEIGLQTCNLMSNLRHLELIGNFENTEDAAELLNEARWPKLESLTLKGQLGSGITMNNEYFTETIILAFNRFRSSLQELKLLFKYGFDFDENTIDDTIVQAFPKMKSLVLASCEIDNPSWIWMVFRLQFANLEHLCFLSERDWGYSYPIPDFTERRKFFNRFPTLKTLTWMIQKDNRTEKTVFIRDLN